MVTAAPGALRFTATLYDEASAAATATQTAARLELQYLPDGASAVSPSPPSLSYTSGTDEGTLSTASNLLATAAHVGSGAYELVASASDGAAFAGGAAWRVAMMIETTDALGASDTSRVPM